MALIGAGLVGVAWSAHQHAEAWRPLIRIISKVLLGPHGRSGYLDDDLTLLWLACMGVVSMAIAVWALISDSRNRRAIDRVSKRNLIDLEHAQTRPLDDI